MRIFLPYPPSVNDRLVPAKGRLVLKSRYREWMKEASWIVALAARDGGGMIVGPYLLTVTAMPPLRRQVRDLDNLVKATCDALVKGGAVEDDSLCQSILIGWGELDDGAGVICEVNPCRLRLSSVVGKSRSPSAIARSHNRHLGRLSATTQGAESGGDSDTDSQGSKTSVSQPSSIPAGSTASPKTKT